LIIYSFDTGESTGVARMDTKSCEVILQTISSSELLGLIQDKDFKPDEVLIERIPESSKFELLLLFRSVISVCTILGIPLTMIAPSQWKPIRDGRKWKCNSSSTVHEDDAYNILRYHLIRKSSWDIGDI
jgi:hypothetical protein